jgi:hypothetical protein
MNEAQAYNPEIVPENTMSAPVPTAEQDEPASQPEKVFTQAELDEIVAKRLAREHRKIERIERQREIEDAERRGRESVLQRQQTNDGPPKREDFESLEEYFEARTDWKVEQRLSERDAKAEEANAVRAEQARQADAERTWNERATKASERYADFADVVLQNEELQISAAMGAAIMGADNGIDVAYHLGKNPQKAAQIAALDPVLQVYELGKLAAALQTKPVSKAPQPVDPVSGGRSGSSNDLYNPNLSTEQYIRLRNKQLAG